MYKIREFPHMSPIMLKEEKYYNSLEECKKELASKFKDRHNNTKYIVFNEQNWIVATITRKDYLYGK